jgi:hypothetical protein
MNPLRTTIRTALCAAAAVLPATGAWALSPADVSALSSSNIIFVSGSTATDAAIKAWAKLDPAKDANAPFKAGTYDLYTTSSKGYILTGTAGPVFGALSGTNIAIVKQTAGGSAIGIHNVQAGVAAASFPDLSNPSSSAFVNTCGAASNTTASSPFQAFNTYACTLESSAIVPNAGISDEDPTTWIGTGGVTAADAANLTAKPAVQVPFAIIVSTALRNQLQTLEGLTSASETLANVPSLSSAQIRAILSHQVSTLSNMYVFNPTTGKTGQVDPSGSFLHVCRRGDTSGSQFAANIRFMGKGCLKGSGVGAVANPDTGTTQANGEAWTGTTTQIGDLVFAGAGTGDVLSCVASPLDTVDGDTVNYRVGFVSTDQVPTTSGGWRYIAVDGVAPTIWNIQLGLYDWMMQDSFNSTTASLALNGGAGNHATIFNTIQANLSNVNALAGLNAASQNAAALSDGSGGGADTGIVTTANKVLYGASDTTGPSAPAWPAAIRAIAVAGQGPNSPINKTYPSSSENNCNGPYVSDPTG